MANPSASLGPEGFPRSRQIPHRRTEIPAEDVSTPVPTPANLAVREPENELVNE